MTLAEALAEAVRAEVARQVAALPAAAPAPAAWLSVAAVGELLDMTPGQARRWLERTPEVNAKRRWISQCECRYPRAEILAFLESRKAPDSHEAAARRSA